VPDRSGYRARQQAVASEGAQRLGEHLLADPRQPAGQQLIRDNIGIGRPDKMNIAFEIGYAASRRLLDAECISHDPAAGAAGDNARYRRTANLGLAHQERQISAFQRVVS
jgi:hypothetical protein